MKNTQTPETISNPVTDLIPASLPEKKKVIKNQLKLLLILTAIYTLIAHQAQKLDSMERVKHSNSVSPVKKENTVLVQNASFLFAKE